jgi:hypothetical protein
MMLCCRNWLPLNSNKMASSAAKLLSCKLPLGPWKLWASAGVVYANIRIFSYTLQEAQNKTNVNLNKTCKLCVPNKYLVLETDLWELITRK